MTDPGTQTRHRTTGRRGHSVHTGQFVAAQAAIAAVIAAAGAGRLTLIAVSGMAVLVVALAVARLRGRWWYEWLGIALRYATRRRALPPNADAEALLALVAPTTRCVATDVDGVAAATLVDPYGVTAVLELGDPTTLLADSAAVLSAPADLLPPAGPQAPAVRVQLLVAAVPAPVVGAGAGPPAASYRQLTEGRTLSQRRALLAVRIARVPGSAAGDVERALSGVVRKIRRRLGALPARPLGETAIRQVLTELAHHDGGRGGRAGWPALHWGGLLQATFRLSRWPDPQHGGGHQLMARLLALPATATTVAITATPPLPGSAAQLSLVVRVAAYSVEGLATAAQALDSHVETEGAAVRRLDGEHLDGLAATLPLGGPAPSPLPRLVPDPWAARGEPDDVEVPIGGAGLVLGRNRHGAALLARVFRPEPTRILLVGGIRCAELVLLRALSLGARVIVRTARPQAWEPFVRGASPPGETIVVLPPGTPAAAPVATALRPVLRVVDVGSVPAEALSADGWQAILVLRDELTPADTAALSRADLVLLQPLQPAEAALAGGVLGLGDATGWLTRIRPDMVGVVNRRTVRWALLAATPIELQLIGPPDRA